MTNGKVALITSATGQDAHYLSDYLASTGEYSGIHHMSRRVVRGDQQIFGTDTDHILPHLREGLNSGLIEVHDGNITDFARVREIYQTLIPDESYNIAAQSNVGLSFVIPEETMATNDIAVGYMLEARKAYAPHCRFYQAGTSEQFGNQSEPQNESTPMEPVSPYGQSKLNAHRRVIHDRMVNGLYSCTGLLFNHESERRGKDFVTRKTTAGIAQIMLGAQEFISFGNLDAKRDWGYAGDYVRMQYLMLQQKVEDPSQIQDYVIATGITRSIRECIETAYAVLDKQVDWDGEGVNTLGRVDGVVRVKCDPKYFRDRELHVLRGDPTKARTELGWEPQVTFEEMIERMMHHDLHLVGL